MLNISVFPKEANAPSFPGLPPWMGQLLRARGVETAEAAQAFLHPTEAQLLSPFALHQMSQAVALLRQAQAKGSRVAIYGDYDVDGVCASAILYEALSAQGISCENYIPQRHEEGYGLNTPAVERLAKRCQVLLTVDCGISSIEEVQAAKAAGMTVIVTDHHRPGDRLPEADAVVSPLLGGYPFPFLCGAGVAWKLALALAGEEAKALLDMAALATVADMVPLTGENRALVALGLERLSATHRPGLRALMAAAGLSGKVTSEQVAFQLAPRMNACGRMASAALALSLLLTRDGAEAEALALGMEKLNQQRKEEENQVIDAALAQVAQMDLVETRAIVVAGEGWNSGVVGLAAGRIAEKFCYPTVALSVAGEQCVGSARSAGDVDIFQALSQCKDLFIRFGGHSQAAGLTLEKRLLPEFRQRLSQAVSQQTGGLPPQPRMVCDGRLSLSQVTEETVGLLSLLEPYGMGNPAPRFLCEAAQALTLRAVGAEGKHLKCTFRQGSALRDGIFFGGGEWAGNGGGSFQMVMTPTLNEFRNRISAECRIHALTLLPETLPRQPEREWLSFLAEERGEAPAEPLTLFQLDALMAGAQGTLLVCRCLETALDMRARYGQADFCLGKASDSRAYHSILLYGGAKGTCASYRHVVLCDGDLGEAGGYAAACPGSKVWALPCSAGMKGLLAAGYTHRDGLREGYVQLRRAPVRDVSLFAQSCGLTPLQGAFVLSVLGELRLAQVNFSPFEAKIAPLIRREPEESPLFRAARNVKEDVHGIFGL